MAQLAMPNCREKAVFYAQAGKFPHRQDLRSREEEEGSQAVSSFKKSRKVFWKSDNKHQFSFGLTKAASFCSMDYIGSKPARHLAKQLSSASWSRLGLRTKKTTLLSHSAEAGAERDKMARLKRLRLEKEDVARLAATSKVVMETELAELPRERSEKRIRNNPKASRSQIDYRPSGLTPKTLSEWLTQQKRDGGRY